MNTFRLHDRVRVHIGRETFNGRIAGFRIDDAGAIFLVQPEDDPNLPVREATARRLRHAAALVYLPADEVVANICGNDHDGVVVSGRIEDNRDFYTVWFGDVELELEWSALRPAAGTDGAR